MMRRPFSWLLALVALYRLSLLGRGAQAFADEQWYFQSVLFLQSLAHGHLIEACSHLTFSFARPGLPLVMTIPGALQAIPFAFGVAASNPVSLLIPTACNVAITLINLTLFYRLTLVLFEGDTVIALGAATMYSLLANTNVYVRHTLGYDWSLCLFLLALWVMLSGPKTFARACGIGALMAGVGAVYPGYFPLVGVAGLVLVTDREGDERAAWWQLAVGFLAALGAVVGSLDIVCRIGGLSYLDHVRQLMGAQTQGSFAEGWSFFSRYLIEVERLGGVALLGGFTVWILRTLSEFARGRLRRIHYLVLAATAAWIWQAFSSATLHSTVLYGRLLHPWFPFLVWATADAIAWSPRRSVRYALGGLAIAVTFGSWIGFANKYYRLAYPADVLYSMGIDTTRLPPGAMRCELKSVSTYASPPPLNRRTGYPYSDRTDYVLVNFCQGLAGTENLKVKTENSRLLYDGPHFMTLPAYGFEGLGPEDRLKMREMDYRVRVSAAK
jgi:hypothetical protein